MNWNLPVVFMMCKTFSSLMCVSFQHITFSHMSWEDMILNIIYDLIFQVNDRCAYATFNQMKNSDI